MPLGQAGVPFASGDSDICSTAVDMSGYARTARRSKKGNHLGRANPTYGSSIFSKLTPLVSKA